MLWAARERKAIMHQMHAKKHSLQLKQLAMTKTSARLRRVHLGSLRVCGLAFLFFTPELFKLFSMQQTAFS